MAQTDESPPSGFILLDKPLGMSSMQAVAHVRRRAGGRPLKVGHAGTLDPLATGLLVVAVGRRATRLVDQIQALPKRYETTIDLSAFTATDDREGQRLEVVVPEPPPRRRIEEVLAAQFTGRIMQAPPAYSAMKVGGRRAYALARAASRHTELAAPPAAAASETIEAKLAPRPVVIHSIRVASYEWPMLALDIECSKGTYIRRLARDIGQALGTGGHCASLRRTAIGPFTISQAQPIDSLPSALAQKDLLSIEEVRAMTLSSTVGSGGEDSASSG